MSAAKITFSVLGGGGEVGANCFLLNVGDQQIMLDCGTHPKREGREALPDFSMITRPPDALIISHGHVDHCGAAPFLCRIFPGVRTFATLPTARIMDRMLHNSVAVMGTIARERGVADYPLYEHRDVNYTMRNAQGLDFNETFDLPLRVPTEVTFLHAGHVLGSASVHLRFPEHSVLYSGDICATEQELMGGCDALPPGFHADTLITEATHGATDESHILPYHKEAYRLGEAVAKTLRQGGTVLIPSFALGRTQEMLNILARLRDEGLIPPVPIYASGLGRAIYELYDRYIDYLKPDAHLRPLDEFGRIGNVWQAEVVRKLISSPCIIVATSGMMLENTPSAMIAQEMVRETHHGIFFVGYVDSETLGYRLLQARPGDALQFGLGQAPAEIRLENIQRFHFSAHASRSDLVRIIEGINPKQIAYVHGDPGAVDWLRDKTGPNRRTFAPGLGDTVPLAG